MKKLILISITALALVFTSCTKESQDSLIAQQAQPNSQANVVSYSFFPVQEAGETHIGFNVAISVVANSVKKFSLIKIPEMPRFNISNPTTGSYIMYDHITGYPSGYSLPYYYYFVFEMNDGSKVKTSEFEVK